MRQVQIESPSYRRVNSGLSNQSKATQLVSGDPSPGNLALEFVLICTLYLFIFRNVIKVNHCNGAVELPEKWLRIKYDWVIFGHLSHWNPWYSKICSYLYSLATDSYQPTSAELSLPPRRPI